MITPPSSAPIKTHRATLARIPRAGCFAIQGLCALYQREAAFRQQVWTFLLSSYCLVWIHTETWARCLVLVGSVLMLIAETFNSALEAIIDYLAPEQHPEAKYIKDSGSAAVFLAIVFWLGAWGVAWWVRF
jgi:diacylglycerol kinase (ATP)